MRRHIYTIARAAAAEVQAKPPDLAPIEAAVLRYLAKHPGSTPRDITRNVRNVRDAGTVLNRLLELGLAARRADDRKGRGRRAQWLYSVSTQLTRMAGWP